MCGKSMCVALHPHWKTCPTRSSPELFGYIWQNPRAHSRSSEAKSNVYLNRHFGSLALEALAQDIKIPTVSKTNGVIGWLEHSAAGSTAGPQLVHSWDPDHIDVSTSLLLHPSNLDRADIFLDRYERNDTEPQRTRESLHKLTLAQQSDKGLVITDEESHFLGKRVGYQIQHFNT